MLIATGMSRMKGAAKAKWRASVMSGISLFASNPAMPAPSSGSMKSQTPMTVCTVMKESARNHFGPKSDGASAA